MSTNDGAAAEAAGVASQDAVAVANNQYGIVVGEPKYADFIYRMCDVYQGIQNDVLDKYHYAGGMIQSHMDETGVKNVTAALGKILDDMVDATHGGLGNLGIDSLRKAHKLNQTFTIVQLELAKAGHVSLRNAMALCVSDVTPEERVLILQDVTEGNIKQTDIPDEVKKLHPSAERDEKRGGARKKVETPLEYIQRIQKEMDKLLEDLKEYRLHAASALGSDNEETKEEYAHLYEAVAEQIEQIYKQRAAAEKVNKAFLEE